MEVIAGLIGVVAAIIYWAVMVNEGDMTIITYLPGAFSFFYGLYHILMGCLNNASEKEGKNDR